MFYSMLTKSYLILLVNWSFKYDMDEQIKNLFKGMTKLLFTHFCTISAARKWQPQVAIQDEIIVFKVALCKLQA